MFEQRTIREKVSCDGIGLHSGRQIKMELLPAPEGNGITFVRTDIPSHPEIRASIDHLMDTTLATSLGVVFEGRPVVIGTVEHLLAAFAGLNIDNVRVHLDGPEVPVFDGSAKHFVEVLEAVGTQAQRKARRFLVIKKDIKVRDGDKLARVSPASRLRIKCSLDFDHPLISPAVFRFEASERSFVRDIASARTFGFLHEVEALRARGLALGGSLDNAIVIDGYRVLNPEGLRFPDEFVRHKVLDALGDLSLFGLPLVGRVSLHRSGHALNTRLVQAVLSDPRAYEIVEQGSAAQSNHERSVSVFEAIESVA